MHLTCVFPTFFLLFFDSFFFFFLIFFLGQLDWNLIFYFTTHHSQSFVVSLASFGKQQNSSTFERRRRTMNSFNKLNKTLHQIYDVVDEPSKAKECVSLCSKALKSFPSVSLFSCVKALAMLRVSEEEENTFEEATRTCETMMGRIDEEENLETDFGPTVAQSLRVLSIFYKSIGDEENEYLVVQKQHEKDPGNCDILEDLQNVMVKKWDLEKAKTYAVKLQRLKPHTGTGGTRAAATMSLAIGMQKKTWRGEEREEGDGEGHVASEEEKENERRKKKKLSGELGKAMFQRMYKSLKTSEYENQERDLTSENARAYVTALMNADVGFEEDEEDEDIYSSDSISNDSKRRRREYPKGDANRKIAVAFLESEVGQKCFAKSSPLERLRLLADLYASLDDAKLKAFQYNVDIIDLAPDDWIAIVNAIELLAELEDGKEGNVDDAIAHLAKLGLSEGSSSSSDSRTMAFAFALRAKSEANGGAKVVGRGPYLAVLEAARQNLFRKKNVKNAQILFESIAEYVDAFASWTSCARELRTFMQALMDCGNAEAIQGCRERLAKRRDVAAASLDAYYDKNDDDDDDKELKKKDAMDALRVEAACRVLIADISRDEIDTAWVTKQKNCYSPPLVYKDCSGQNRARIFMERFEKCETLVESLDSREWTPRDVLGVYATHALVAEAASCLNLKPSRSALKSEIIECHSRAVMFLVCAKALSKRVLQRSKHNAEALFDEISSSCLLGASRSMLDTFAFLDAKNIQMASLFHHVVPALDGNSVSMEKFHEIRLKCESLQQQSDVDIGESFAKALRYEAFDKALEFTRFRDTLKRSFAFSQMDAISSKFRSIYLHDMGLIEHAGLDVDITDKEEFNLKVKKRFDHVTKQFAVASQNCSNGILCIGNGDVEEQHEMNMLYLWKNLCFTYTDDATGTNSSWLPPHLSAPALAAPSWFLAQNSCATNNASYRDEWTRNHLLESLAYFSVASLGSCEENTAERRKQTIREMFEHRVGKNSASGREAKEEDGEASSSWTRTNVFAFNETFIQAIIRNTSATSTFDAISRIVIGCSRHLSEDIRAIASNKHLPNSIKFALDGIVPTTSYVTSHVLTVSCNALLLMIEGKIFESADKNELKQSLKPVIDAMDGLLLAVREGAIDVLKKCNENEDDARAGEFCATNSSIFIPGITAELTQKIATELRTNHLESFEIAAKRIEFLRTEFVLFGFSTD